MVCKSRGEIKMKKVIYILASLVAFAGCNSFWGGLDDSNQELRQIVIINRSSHKIDLSIDGVDWISPLDTIRLKPENGLYKQSKYVDHYYNFDTFNAIMYARFNDGEKEMYFDRYSDFPYNLNYNIKNLYDSKGEYQVIEFSDNICDSLFKYHEERLIFEMSNLYYPNNIIDSLCTKGSSEAWYQRLFATSATRNKLRLGAVVSKEAETLNDIQFLEGYSFVPDSVEVKDSSHLLEIPYHAQEKSRYYSIENLRKFSMAHFGCDFAELIGHEKMDKFCGVILMNVWKERGEYMLDVETTEEIIRRIGDSSSDIRVIDSIIYGDLMILLAEADCSGDRLQQYIQYSVFKGGDGDKNYLDVLYHLITMSAEGDFVCRSGGEELAMEFEAGFKSPAAHPIMFSPTIFGLGESWIHIPDFKTEDK